MPIPGTTKNIFSRFAKGLLCAGIIAAIVASCSSDDEDAAPHASNYGVASGDPKADGSFGHVLPQAVRAQMKSQ